MEQEEFIRNPRFIKLNQGENEEELIFETQHNIKKLIEQLENKDEGQAQ